MSRRRGRGSHRRYERTDRVNEAVLQVVADALCRLSDPRVDLVTITGVAVTSDLGYATVYFAPPPGRDSAEAGDGLRSAASNLRRAVGSQLRLRQVPELRFREDPAIVRGRRIEAILRGAQNDGPAGDDEEREAPA